MHVAQKSVQFSHVRVFSGSRNVQKSVTRIIYLGPPPVGRVGRARVMGQAVSESWCAKNVLPSRFPPHARVWRRRPHQAALARRDLDGQWPVVQGRDRIWHPPQSYGFSTAPPQSGGPALQRCKPRFPPLRRPSLLRMHAPDNGKIQKRYGYGSDKYGSDIGVGQCTLHNTDRTSSKDNEKIQKREAIEDLRLRRGPVCASRAACRLAQVRRPLRPTCAAVRASGDPVLALVPKLERE